MGCSQQKDMDQALNGVWEVTVTDAQTQEKTTYLYEFDDQDVKVVKSNDSDIFSNHIELKTGSYVRSVEDGKQKIRIAYSVNSCANISQDTSYLELFSYDFLEGIDKVQFRYGLNKTLTLRRLNDDEVRSRDQDLETAVAGCFVKDSSGRSVFRRAL